MSPVILPEIKGHLAVRVLEDVMADGYGLIRTDCSPAVEVAIVRDGPDRGIGETEAYIALLARSPGMKRLLDKAVAFETAAFDEDEPVCGASLVEWFASWRLEVLALLTRPLPPVLPVPDPDA
ncbi:hypothetical protein ROTAS13_03999 [Roseomonas sp. TAS13]|uniref:hypothetical protein n=1 Tax=Roseomonas TaxID=125216 RepID=UPI00095EF599|nr:MULTISPECIES: hypothetical protein [Roseomonas]MCG7353733.1 hypothetical protein [Roseomonas mucosa]MCG7359575.1 hypothetical protein [Roseomonas mucosa]GAV36312.1 hypothetical protein ROTAS13_03999 [Roseomonas sp. TAS13]